MSERMDYPYVGDDTIKGDRVEIINAEAPFEEIEVYPVREDVPADLWGKPIPPKSERKKMTSPLYDSIWNPWNKAYKNIKLNVTFNMKVKKNDIQSQDSESTRTDNGNDKPKKVLRNARRK